MKHVSVRDAVGMVLCHDVTRIVPGEYKGPAFKKGHIITPADVAPLLDLGKAHVFVYELAEGHIHEDDAAARIASAAAGAGLRMTSPSEGRVNLTAVAPGLLKVNVEALKRINLIEDVVFTTLHTNTTVGRGQPVAGTRIIPLVTREDYVVRVESICRERNPVIEVFHRRIEDKFGPVLRTKFAEMGCPVLGTVFVSDDADATTAAIRRSVDEGAGMVMVTGGMSVDPDDRSPAALRNNGARVVTYGAPVFPGAMFMLAYLGTVPILGLPGCVMYHRASIFDLIVPRLLAGETITREDVIELGHGGFCSGCEICTFPRCGFGK